MSDITVQSTYGETEASKSFVYMVRVSCKWLSFAAYAILLIPIYLFLIGWLRPALAVIACVALTAAFVLMVKHEYDNEDDFSIDVKAIVLIGVLIGLWVYISGIGGFWPQKSDWHWRNAMLRDLIDYSWPVVYPRTGGAFTYYFNFFLPAAAVGKLFGWEIANATMLVFTWVGICVTLLLLCRYLYLQTFAQVSMMVLVFVLWSVEIPLLRDPLLAALGVDEMGYQYSGNEILLQWVINQTLAPWIAVALFLNKRDIRNYALLGLCVLGSAPLPFIGFFLILVADGLCKLVTEYKKRIRVFFIDMMSPQNVLSTLTLLPVFALFYSCNRAATDSSVGGGFGLYVPIDDITKHSVFSLLTFLCTGLLVYAVILLRTNRTNNLYWIVIASLLLIPLFKIGTSYDFCMRASIPASFILMTLVINYLVHNDKAQVLAKAIITGFLAIVFAEYYSWNVGRFASVLKGDSTWCDAIHSYANKLEDASYCGGPLLNFICYRPDEQSFFQLLGKEKGESDIRRDITTTQSYVESFGYELVSGYYSVSPIEAEGLSLGFDEKGLCMVDHPYRIAVSNSTTPAQHEFLDPATHRYYTYSSTNCVSSMLDMPGLQAQSPINVPDDQLFHIAAVKGGYMITCDNVHALTYADGSVAWSPIDYSANQVWKVEQLDSQDQLG